MTHDSIFIPVKYDSHMSSPGSRVGWPRVAQVSGHLPQVSSESGPGSGQCTLHSAQSASMGGQSRAHEKCNVHCVDDQERAVIK